MKLSSVLALTLSSGIVAFTAAVPAASAAFIDAYTPSNWTLTNSNADGSVDTSAVPDAITVLGGDNGSGLTGTTDFSIPIASDGSLAFNWNYQTEDDPSINDLAFYLLNGIPFQLTDTNASTQSGVVSIPVAANDVFAFRVETVDNQGGRASLTITNFEATAIPTPALLPGILTFALASASTVRQRRSHP
jgi:hypothetical protein